MSPDSRATHLSGTNYFCVHMVVFIPPHRDEIRAITNKHGALVNCSSCLLHVIIHGITTFSISLSLLIFNSILISCKIRCLYTINVLISITGFSSDFTEIPRSSRWDLTNWAGSLLICKMIFHIT